MIFIRIYKRLRARHGKKGSKAHASGDGGNFNITADALSLGRSHSSDFVRTSTSTRDNDKSTLSKMRAVKEATKRSRLKKEAQSKKWGVDYRAEGDRSPHDRERTQVSSPTDRAGHSEREGSHVFPRSGSHDREAYWDATLSPVQAPESPSRAKETAFSSVRRESHGGPRSPLRRSPLGRSPLGAVVPRPQAGYLSATLGGGGGGGGGGDVSRTGGGARGGNAPQTPKGGGREREPRVGRRPSSRDPDLQ
ncbi:hypothetical protein T484DRAFT_2977288 [Baffinella frigidus]|nr:hypothetical protein T484DRAFT_2977288 [Cryptophyta sp. CCMP2293]